MVDSRDKSRLIAMIKHCLVIEDVMKEVNNSYEKFISREMYKSAVIYSLSQIGENANYLTKDFVENNKNISWKEIIRTRHIMVHHYETIDYNVLWNTCKKDIPKLRTFIKNIIKEEQIKTTYEEFKI